MTDVGTGRHEGVPYHGPGTESASRVVSGESSFVHTASVASQSLAGVQCLGAGDPPRGGSRHSPELVGVPNPAPSFCPALS